MSMKKITMIMVLGVVSVFFSSCTAETKNETFQIGVLQLVTHNSLDETYEGFLAGLKEAGLVEGTDFTIDFQNAHGNMSNIPTIASKLVNDKNDLLLAISTPAALGMANATDTIPILITAVTDPAESALVESNEKPGKNLTGTSDLTPVAEQINFLHDLLPTATKVGVLYTSSETNSQIQANLAKEAGEVLGLEMEFYTVSNSNQIQQVMQSMMGKVEAIYIPTDNTMAAAMPLISAIAIENKIPVIVGSEGMASDGALATYGISYFELGKITANQAIRIMNGEDPSNMPIEYVENFYPIINEEVATKLAIEIPATYKK